MASAVVHRPEVDRVLKEILAETGHVHVRGEPGIGKSSLVDLVDSNLPDEVAMSILEIPRYRGLDYQASVVRDLIDLVREQLVVKERAVLLAQRVEGVSLPIVGVGTSIRSKEASDPREFEKIATMDRDSDYYVLCLDEINKLAGEQAAIRDFLDDLVTQLADATVLTAGTIDLSEATSETVQITLRSFDRDQSREFLEATTSELSTQEMEQVHEELGGHPYYLEQFAQEDIEALAAIPDGEIRSFIERRYLDVLSPSVERFLRELTPLQYLHFDLCKRVYTSVYEMPEAEADTHVRRALRELDTEALVREVATIDEKSWVALHDKFHDFLVDQADQAQQETVRRIAFNYYVTEALQSGSVTPSLFTLGYTHLKDIYDGSIGHKELKRELGATSLSLDEITGVYPQLEAMGDGDESRETISSLRSGAHTSDLTDGKQYSKIIDGISLVIFVFLAKLYWMELVYLKYDEELAGLPYVDRIEHVKDTDYWETSLLRHRGPITDPDEYDEILDMIPPKIRQHLPRRGDVVGAHEWAINSLAGFRHDPVELRISGDITRVTNLRKAAQSSAPGDS